MPAYLLESASVSPIATAFFSRADQLFPLVDALFASLHATLPSGMRGRLDDPEALRAAIRAYADNLERIQPGTEAVTKAQEVMASDTLAYASKIDKQAQEQVLEQLRVHIAILTQRQPDTAEIAPLRQVQDTLEMLARRASPRAKTLSADLDTLTERICDPATPEHMQETLQQARAALRSMNDHNAQRSAAHAMHALVSELKQKQATPKECTALMTFRATYTLLESIGAGKVIQAATLENQLSALQALLSRHGTHVSTDVDEGVVREVCIALSALINLRILQETLLVLQQREAEVAIKQISILSKASSEIMTDGLSGLLPSATRADRFSVIDRLNASQDSLLCASEWVRNRNIACQAKRISGRFTRELAKAIQSPPSHQAGRRLGDLLFEVAASSHSARLLRYLSHFPAIGGTGTDRHMYAVWRNAMHNPSLSADDRSYLTTNMYLRGQILNPDYLIEKWESRELRSADLKTAIQALIDLPLEGHAELIIYRRQEARKWVQALYDECMPTTFGDLAIQLAINNGIGHVEEALLIASDQIAKAKIEACMQADLTPGGGTATGISQANIAHLLEFAAFARKPACIALLLSLHTDAAALPPLLESLMSGVLDRNTYRPRDAGHVQMLLTTRHMIDAGLTANYQDHNRANLLHEVASLASKRARSPESLAAQVEMVDFLVERGADINAVSAFDRTPLELRFEVLHKARIPLAADPLIARLRHHGSTVQQAINRISGCIRNIPLLTPYRDRKVASYLRLISVMTDFIVHENTQQAAATGSDAPDASSQGDRNAQRHPGNGR